MKGRVGTVGALIYWLIGLGAMYVVVQLAVDHSDLAKEVKMIRQTLSGQQARPSEPDGKPPES
jgi:uncharacterized membrane protein YuzA (DUF378 family)